jgi:hypothetical protein
MRVPNQGSEINKNDKAKVHSIRVDFFVLFYRNTQTAFWRVSRFMVEVMQPFLSFLERNVHQFEELAGDSRAFQDPSVKPMFQQAVSDPEFMDEILGQLAAFLWKSDSALSLIR